MCLSKLLGKKTSATRELPSPRVAIDSNKIVYDEATETLTIKGIKPPVRITTVAESNSMEPAIDADHYTVCSSNPIYMSPDMIKPGDVIIYNALWAGGQVIHAVTEVGKDKDGWYCKCQGWNCANPDPEKIRISQILQVVLMVVWCGKEDEP